jgi:hypothetical protein
VPLVYLDDATVELRTDLREHPIEALVDLLGSTQHLDGVVVSSLVEQGTGNVDAHAGELLGVLDLGSQSDRFLRSLDRAALEPDRPIEMNERRERPHPGGRIFHLLGPHLEQVGLEDVHGHAWITQVLDAAGVSDDGLEPHMHWLFRHEALGLVVLIPGLAVLTLSLGEPGQHGQCPGMESRELVAVRILGHLRDQLHRRAGLASVSQAPGLLQRELEVGVQPGGLAGDDLVDLDPEPGGDMTEGLLGGDPLAAFDQRKVSRGHLGLCHVALGEAALVAQLPDPLPYT